MKKNWNYIDLYTNSTQIRVPGTVFSIITNRTESSETVYLCTNQLSSLSEFPVIFGLLDSEEWFQIPEWNFLSLNCTAYDPNLKHFITPRFWNLVMNNHYQFDMGSWHVTVSEGGSKQFCDDNVPNVMSVGPKLSKITYCFFMRDPWYINTIQNSILFDLLPTKVKKIKSKHFHIFKLVVEVNFLIFFLYFIPL